LALRLVEDAAGAGARFFYGLRVADGGLASAQAMCETQGVTLADNEQGRLVDRIAPRMRDTDEGRLN
jgi:hypothetical protein